MSLKFQKKSDRALTQPIISITPGEIEIVSNNNWETQKIKAKYLQLLAGKKKSVLIHIIRSFKKLSVQENEISLLREQKQYLSLLNASP